MIVFVLAAATLIADVAPPTCVGHPRAPRLDHVIIAVRDLDAASRPFRNSGFRLKPGRLHANNLLNRHIKFRNGTSIELMTVRGQPGDAMARDYANLLTAGEGGVYLALSVPAVDTIDRTARALGLTTRRSTSGPWSFLSFPGNSPAAAVFFSSGNVAMQDPDSLLSHTPDVVGMTEVWIEAGREFVALLERLGARRCGAVTSPGGLMGQRYGLSLGSVIITSPRGRVRARVRGVTLQSGGAVRDSTLWPHATFWVHYKSVTD